MPIQQVHKDIYCGSRHCSQKIQQPSINLVNPRKRTISDTLTNNNLPSSSLASTTSAVVNNITSITNLLGSVSSISSSPPNTNPLAKTATSIASSQSPQQNLFNQTNSLTNQINSAANTNAVQQLSTLCKNSALLNTNASTSEAGSPNLQQQTAGIQSSSMANLNNSNSQANNNCNIPASLTANPNMNVHQTALLNELFANGNIINLSQSLNIIQQLSQPAYIAISTNPLILLPINSALQNNSSSNNKNSPSSSNSNTNNQDVTEQLLNSQINGLLNQAVIESLSKGNSSFLNLLNQQSSENNLQLNASSMNSSPINRTGDGPMDLSVKRKCTSSRLSSVASLIEQQENLVNNSSQLLKNIDALNSLNPSDLASFLLPKTLNSQQLQQLMLKQQNLPKIYSCNNCQIDFHKQENYLVHKRHYCSATKQLEQQVNNLNSTSSSNSLQKQSPTPDDLDSINYQLANSGPNSPQSNQSTNQQTANRTTSAASSSTLTSSVAAVTSSLIDSINNSQANKKSTSLSLVINKNSGCVSPNNMSSSNNSPASSPPTFLNNNNQLKTTANSTINNSIQPSQPIYKFFCNKCGIRFTSQDNLLAHQTYYCISNNHNGSISTITSFNSASGLTEVTCPKCKYLLINSRFF